MPNVLSRSIDLGEGGRARNLRLRSRSQASSASGFAGAGSIHAPLYRSTALQFVLERRLSPHRPCILQKIITRPSHTHVRAYWSAWTENTSPPQHWLLGTFLFPFPPWLAARQVASDMPPTLTLYRGRAGFESLREDWDAFAFRYGSHFLHFPAWYGAALEYTGDVGVYFLALRDRASELIAILPLQYCHIVFKGVPVPVLQIYDSNEMGVNDVLAREPLQQYWILLSDFLRREMPYFLFVRWQCILENGWARTIAPSQDSFRTTHDSKFLNFHRGAEAFFGSYSSKFKTGLLKKIRKISELGALRLEVVSNALELPAAFERLLNIEDSGWKGENGSSIRKQPGRQNYYRYLLEHYGRIGVCRIILLFLGETAIAAQFCIEIGEYLYILKIGFEEAYGEFSPGALLLYKSVYYHSENTPVRTISFVTGSEWIDRWHPSTVHAGIFYADRGTMVSKFAVRMLGWGVRWREQHKISPLSDSAASASCGNPLVVQESVAEAQAASR